MIHAKSPTNPASIFVAELGASISGGAWGMNFSLKSLSRMFVAAALVCAVVGAQAPAIASATPTIVTGSGPLTGITTAALNEYLGIPYAAPPVGALRWMPPKAFGHWPGTLQATHFGRECPQLDALGKPTGAENCLYLNVYTPQTITSALPVMVWIHGGGLTAGSGEDYAPGPLVVQGNVIVVTINYRLGLLGFFAQTALDAEGHLAGNYGLMDQQFALKWVQQNIAAFGGDPTRVTMFGESAGGQSVYANLASPRAAGLFQRAIAESGSYASFTDYDQAIIPLADAETVGSAFEESGAAFADAVRCPSQTSACLRKVPPPTLIKAQPFPMYPFVDGVVLPNTLGVAFATGAFNRVPVISGTNHDEYRLFVAADYDDLGNPLTNAEYMTAVDTVWGSVLGPIVLDEYPLPANPPADAASLALGASGTDGIFSCPARLADQSLSQYVTTYTYEFSDENAPLYTGILPASFPLGAYHSAEIQYLMNILGIPAPFTSDQTDLSEAMISYWTQFAATGDPNSADQPVWSPYNSATDEFQSFVPPTPTVDSTFATDHLCTTLWDFL
jgi:para-nitrobenzyl esterase